MKPPGEISLSESECEELIVLLREVADCMEHMEELMYSLNEGGPFGHYPLLSVDRSRSFADKLEKLGGSHDSPI